VALASAISTPYKAVTHKHSRVITQAEACAHSAGKLFIGTDTVFQVAFFISS